jgi:hypothetical protein
MVTAVECPSFKPGFDGLLPTDARCRILLEVADVMDGD